MSDFMFGPGPPIPIQGRSFGTNALEAALTAYAGQGRALRDGELNTFIDELGLGPKARHLNP